MITIPTFADPSYTQVSNIDGVDYVLVFRWSEREAIWRMDLADLDGANLASNLPMHASTDLLGRARAYGSALPPGLLYVFDTTGAGVDPGQNELGDGKRCVLVYFTPSEVAAAS